MVTATVSFFLMEFWSFLSNAAINDPCRSIADNVDPETGGWLAVVNSPLPARITT